MHVSTATGWVLLLYTGHLLHEFSALVSFSSSDDLNESLARRANLQFTWMADTSGDWRVVRLSSLCCCCSDRMLKISSCIRHEEQIRSSQAVRMDGA